MSPLFIAGLVSTGVIRRMKRRIIGCARAATYLFVLSGCLLAVLARASWVRAEERTAALSAQLMPLAHLLEGATAIRVNGERLSFGMTTFSDRSVRQVLDEVEAHCLARPGPLMRKLQLLAARLPARGAETEVVRKLLASAAVNRTESEGGGSIWCMTGDSSDASPHGALELDATMDLGTLGDLRFVTASRGSAEIGEANVTKVVSLWTEGTFRLSSLEPPLQGDAPGSDSRLVPRPPNSTRLFTAEAADAPYAVRIYETNTAPDRALAFYDSALGDWASGTPTGSEDRVRGYVKESRPVMITVSRDEAKTLVTISELGGSNTDAPPER